MDIFFHGLAGAVAGKATRKIQKKEPEKWTFRKLFPWIAWGMFPDAIAFIPAMIIGFFSSGMTQFAPHSLNEYSGAIGIAYQIYNFSHSLVIFLIVFFLVRLIRGKYPLVLLGWPLHILMDIPLHTKDFFPTPLFFPLSGWKFQHGIHWAYPPVFFGLWALAIALYIILSRKKKVIHDSPVSEKV